MILKEMRERGFGASTHVGWEWNATHWLGPSTSVERVRDG